MSASALLLCLVSPIAAAETPLTCADKKTYALRISDVTAGCRPGEVSLGAGPIPIPDAPAKGLHPKLRVRFLAAQAAAADAGFSLRISSGFRTIERQRFLFKRAIKRNGSYEAAARWVAPPNVSRHPKGTAIDVNYPSGSKAAAAWLEKNGSTFGLCRVFKNEWWHFEPVIAPGDDCPPLMKDATDLLK